MTTTSLILFNGTDTNGSHALWVSDGTAAGTSEISVAGAYADGLDPDYLTVIGNLAVFEGLDTNLAGAPASALWVTNGTAAGTSELVYGMHITSSIAFGSVALLGSYNGVGSTNDLYVTNGTAAGTINLSKGLAGASPNGLTPTNFTVFGSEVLFEGRNASGRFGLWVTKGTAATTSEISIAAPSPHDLTTFGSKVLFASNGNLWITDGTAAGTTQLATFLNPSDITVLGNKALFNSSVDNSGLTFRDVRDDLWITDGTAAGTSKISVAGAYSDGVNPTNMVTLGSKVLFNGQDANGRQGLWVTNGTSAGTSELSIAGAAGSGYGLDPSNFVVFKGKAYFQGQDANGLVNLWVTDGTAAGTSELPNIAGAAMSSPVATNPVGLTAFGNKVLFGAASGGLWITNGTASGTSLVSATATPFVYFGELTADPIIFNGKVMFGAKDPNEFFSDWAIWLTDGTAAGTTELSTIAGAYGGGRDLNPTDFTVLGNKVVFAGWDDKVHVNLWVTDGTAAGTSELSVAGAASSGLIAIDSNSFTVSDMVAFGGKVLFEGQNANGYGGLWVTNGTAAGTSELQIAGSYAGGFFYGPNNAADHDFSPDFTVFGNKVWFTGIDANGNYGLWVTNGTAAGTSELSIAGADGAGYAIYATDMTAFGSMLLFNGTDAYGDYGLWVSNGTAAGTSELSIAGAYGDGYYIDPTDMVVFGSVVLFNGIDADGSRGLWVTNGTAAGTSELSVSGAYTNASYYTGYAGLDPINPVVLGSQVLFSGRGTDGTRHLWITNGTAAGTSEYFPQLYPELTPSELTAFVLNLNTVGSGQTLTVSSGQTDTGDIILSGGTEIVLSGGTTNLATVSAGGTLNVSSGGIANNPNINGGTVNVSSGGTVNNTTVSAGGTLNILAGGHGDPTTINAGGTETIYAGGRDTGVQVNGGSLYLYGSAPNLVVSNGGKATVEPGGSVAGAAVSGGGTLTLLNGGSVSGVTVGNGGTFAFTGSKPSGITVQSGGRIAQANGGSLTYLAYVYQSGLNYYVNSYNLSAPIQFATWGNSSLIGNITVSTNADGSFNVFYTSATPTSGGAATYNAIRKSYSGTGALNSTTTLVSATAANGATGGTLNYFSAAANGSTPFYAYVNNNNFYVVGSGTGSIQFASGSNIGNVSVSANADSSFQVFWTTSTTSGSNTNYTITENSYAANGTRTSSRQLGGTFTIPTTNNPAAVEFFDGEGNSSGGYAYAYQSGSAYYVTTNSLAAPIQFASNPAGTLKSTVGNISVSLNADGTFAVLWTSDSQSNQSAYTTFENTYSSTGTLTSSQQLGNFSFSTLPVTNYFNADTVSVGPAPLFTTGKDTVNFNNLTPAQQALIAGGADIYNGLGGGDEVTLPDLANYNVSVGNGKTLNWLPTSVFSTGSRAGETYTLTGGTGSYRALAGAGTDNITITGNGSSQITTGAGGGTITIGGNGSNTINGSVSSSTVVINGNGNNTINGGSVPINGSVSQIDSLNALKINGTGTNTLNSTEII